jgi:hypothetical protein
MQTTACCGVSPDLLFAWVVLLRPVGGVVGAGPARTSKKQREEVLKMTAFHEAGHTLTAMLTKHTQKLHKVTILPRGRSGGSVRSEDFYRGSLCGRSRNLPTPLPLPPPHAPPPLPPPIVVSCRPTFSTMTGRRGT